MEFEIRLANCSDIPELVRLRLAYFAEEFGTLPAAQISAISAQLPQYFSESLDTGCIAAAAARQDGSLASCALLTVSVKPANPFFPNGRTGYVLGVYTDPDDRCKGLATAVMKLIQEEAVRLCLDQVTLSASDMGKSIYEKIGFHVKQSKFTEMEWLPGQTETQA